MTATDNVTKSFVGVAVGVLCGCCVGVLYGWCCGSAVDTVTVTQGKLAFGLFLPLPLCQRPARWHTHTLSQCFYMCVASQCFYMCVASQRFYMCVVYMRVASQCFYMCVLPLRTSSMCRVGQNRIFTLYMAVCLVNSLPNTPYINRIYIYIIYGSGQP